MIGTLLPDLAVHFFQGLAATLSLKTFLALCLGVFMGFWVGILPGVGGPATLAILIPLTFSLDPYSAFALLLGMISVTSAAGDMTAILFGIPGESSNAAIVLDGTPMAKRGEAGRALGAVLVASLIGAIIGAVCLAVGIMMVRPLVLSIGYVEFLMLSLAGIAFLASLSTGAVFKGFAAGAFGLLLATVGLSQVTGVERYTFGMLYLWEGVGFIPALLGLFAIPELIDMTLSKAQGKAVQERVKGAWEGVKDSIRHFGVIFRCSMLASYIGLLPGMGASISQWVAYGHAAQSVKRKETIGKGAIECVVGPGAATAATSSGSLIPTIAFGIPGSPQMAIMLGAFLVHGLVPGPNMLIPEAEGGHLTFTFSLVWMIVISNIIMVAGLFLILNHLARVSYINPYILLPFIVILVFIGGYTEKNQMPDLITCFVFGIIGWIMVRLGWPRPPLILGMVLGALIENNLFLAVQSYGMTWLTFPSVIIISSIIILTLIWPAIRKLLSRMRVGSDGHPRSEQAVQFTESSDITPPSAATYLGDFILAGVLATIFAAAILYAWDWSLSAKLMPICVATVGLLLVMCQLLKSCYLLRKEDKSGVADLLAITPNKRAAFLIAGIYAVFYALILLLGFSVGAALLILICVLVFTNLGTLRAFALAVFGGTVVYYGFGELLKVPFPAGYLIETYML